MELFMGLLTVAAMIGAVIVGVIWGIISHFKESK